MARQYSHKQFFRQVPNTLLQRYFQEKKQVLENVPFKELRETEVDPIFDAFTRLSGESQAEIEAEFQDIDTMSCQGGVTALSDEADFHKDSEFLKEIAQIDGFHGKVMWTYLEHPRYWSGGRGFLHSDSISVSKWKKRNDFPHLPPKVEEEDIKKLSQAISDHFYKKEGRGRNCMVDVFRRHEKEYFFAYPEDFAQSSIEWVRNLLSPQARHPAFEIIFVYTQVEGSLDIYAPRNTKSVPVLQQIFAKTILGMDELDEFGGNQLVYNLDDLADRNFSFKYSIDSGIDEVMITQLRLSLKTGNKKRVTVEADPSYDRKAIFDLIDQLNLPPFHVSQAEIKVNFVRNPETRSHTRKFKISYPNWCALRHDGRDLIIRKMLIDSGIEPIKKEEQKDETAA